jgi:saccharopine dehydrogenase-like NADP-dependent oxidoreductase
MRDILVLGAGKIGSLIACLLANTRDYRVFLADRQLDGEELQRLQRQVPAIKVHPLDTTDTQLVLNYIKSHNIAAVISALPYYLNANVATIARRANIHYFDLTEDIETTAQVTETAMGASSAFVPQCGLAPGFISIAANALMKKFSELDAVKLRVGALPQQSDNALQYALTWSTEGVINEYGNPCYGIREGQPVVLQPLEGLETIKLDGLSYEAFNTSGGLGSLDKIYAGKVRNMDYKTLRYPGHCEKMRVLMNDLRLNTDRKTLKRVLERAIPKTLHDVVLVYVSVTGMREGQYLNENYFCKFYPREIAGLHWTAIQVSTAAGLTSVFDLVMQAERREPGTYSGLVLQECFTHEAILQTQFGTYLQEAEWKF